MFTIRFYMTKLLVLSHSQVNNVFVIFMYVCSISVVESIQNQKHRLRLLVLPIVERHYPHTSSLSFPENVLHFQK